MSRTEKVFKVVKECIKRTSTGPGKTIFLIEQKPEKEQDGNASPRLDYPSGKGLKIC